MSAADPVSSADPGTLFSVAGRHAVVTGATSGIGLAVAEGLVRAGAVVLLSSRKEHACRETAERLRGLGRCVAVPADVGTPEGADALDEAVGAHLSGRVDLLVNNAGATWGAPLEDFPDAAWHKLVDVNLLGVFRLTVRLLPALRASATAADPARVVNIGSIGGMRVTAMENYPYSATKAAVHMLTSHLAARLAREHVTVNALAPGYFPSRMSAFALDDPQTRADLVAGIPMGRVGSAEDIVGATLFLASRAGAYLTGTVIPVDGGVTGCT